MKEQLKLSNQLCFPLYACAKEVVRSYTPFLEPLGLTYTQYVAMMVLWEHHSIGVKEMGELLFLDSGTLTPMLKKMEQRGWLTRERSKSDERRVVVTITPEGEQLQERAQDIPWRVAQCVSLGSEDMIELHGLLGKLLNSLKADK
ncbi:MAG: MarR family transcriptional regulator [Tidjanibacter sp.]|nr:MarR family transcriptional regulator [Tidjanibacter sp.]